jgi:hypothetical protein
MTAEFRERRIALAATKGVVAFESRQPVKGKSAAKYWILDSRARFPISQIEKGYALRRNPLIYWLLDLGSNQGPTDYQSVGRIGLQAAPMLTLWVVGFQYVLVGLCDFHRARFVAIRDLGGDPAAANGGFRAMQSAGSTTGYWKAFRLECLLFGFAGLSISAWPRSNCMRSHRGGLRRLQTADSTGQRNGLGEHLGRHYGLLGSGHLLRKPRTSRRSRRRSLTFAVERCRTVISLC